jgi:hypothetical protein
MRRSDNSWTFSAVAFVVFAAALGTLVSRYVAKLADKVEDNFGYVPNPEATAEFLSQLDQPRFAQAGKDCMDNVQKKDTLLYRYADEAHRAVYGKPFAVWNQGSAGTCVSFGWAMGSYIGQCVDWKQGELPAPPKLVFDGFCQRSSSLVEPRSHERFGSVRRDAGLLGRADPRDRL